MAKFGQFKFAEAQFGSKYVGGERRNRTYKSTILGVRIRRSIAKKVIYRIQTLPPVKEGKPGYRIQNKYNYFVPPSIDNIEGEPQRIQFKAAILKWQTGLTDEEKKTYNDRAGRKLHMSGYNLFIREALKGLVDMYVDRGDPAAYDFAKEDLTIDGAWHDLDLGHIVPAAAKLVSIMGMIEGANINWNIIFRKKGNTNEVNHDMMSTLRAGVLRHRNNIVSVDTNLVVEYKADNENWTTLDLVVRGWWT